uniref:FAF domain-containing protein n=1 Tax=Kalanchoe fedtschenkoi TaxID=63787 RepID=A0A7N0TZX8_KALFE
MDSSSCFMRLLPLHNFISHSFMPSSNLTRNVVRARARIIMSGCAGTSLAGDHVGADSCIDLRTSEEFEVYMQERRVGCGRSRNGGGLGSVVGRKELPPPLPRLPWIMRRYSTSDGRLIIRREEVGHCEYLRAQRCEGRLVMRLVSIENGECRGQTGVDEDDEEEDCSAGADSETSPSSPMSLPASENVHKGAFSCEKGSSTTGAGGNKCLTSPSAALSGACASRYFIIS